MHIDIYTYRYICIYIHTYTRIHLGRVHLLPSARHRRIKLRFNYLCACVHGLGADICACMGLDRVPSHVCRGLGSITLNPTTYSLFPTPYTLHPTPYALRPNLSNIPGATGNAINPLLCQRAVGLQDKQPQLWTHIQLVRQRVKVLVFVGRLHCPYLVGFSV